MLRANLLRRTEFAISEIFTAIQQMLLPVFLEYLMKIINRANLKLIHYCPLL
jgi:hypothetical protein